MNGRPLTLAKNQLPVYKIGLLTKLSRTTFEVPFKVSHEIGMTLIPLHMKLRFMKCKLWWLCNDIFFMTNLLEQIELKLLEKIELKLLEHVRLNSSISRSLARCLQPTTIMSGRPFLSRPWINVFSAASWLGIWDSTMKPLGTNSSLHLQCCANISAALCRSKLRAIKNRISVALSICQGFHYAWLINITDSMISTTRKINATITISVYVCFAPPFLDLLSETLAWILFQKQNLPSWFNPQKCPTSKVIYQEPSVMGRPKFVR